jgi:crossover junction endodeoxyribonuclease RusA
MTSNVLAITRFWVSGRPAPQGSKRHIGGGRMIEMSKSVGPWREAVRGEAQRAFSAPLEGPVKVSVEFLLAKPKSVRRDTPCVRPDLDKLIRAVLDGLTAGGAFGDDAQVTELSASKSYATVSGAWITVERAGAHADAQPIIPTLPGGYRPAVHDYLTGTVNLETS